LARKAAGINTYSRAGRRPRHPGRGFQRRRPGRPFAFLPVLVYGIPNGIPIRQEAAIGPGGVNAGTGDQNETPGCFASNGQSGFLLRPPASRSAGPAARGEPKARPMAFINLRTREIQIKIVYYGPAFSGKTANLVYFYEAYRERLPSELLRVNASGDRTIFFDFLPFTLQNVGGFNLKVRLYTVPGQDQYDEVRRTVLKGVDGIVFVADVSAMRKSNLLSLKNLQAHLRGYRKDIAKIPMVFQFNKHDLGESGAPVLSVATLLNDLNSHLRKPFFLASATGGRNVVATLKKVVTMTMDAIETRYSEVSRVG
jgi:hypothetical protein